MILQKFQPKVIAITGSVGKTSAKEAIFAVIRAKHPEFSKVRKNIKNYNNEFGLPFTIIGIESPKRNIFKWLALFAKSFWLIYFSGEYPEVLVLELGIDHPGDMHRLLQLIKPEISVLTTVGISHMEFFGSQEKLFEEKVKIFSALSSSDYAILNIDDPKAASAKSIINSRLLTYGKDPAADLQIVSYKIANEKNKRGTLAHLSLNAQAIQVFCADVIGFGHVSALACGAAVGAALEMNAGAIEAGLASYRPEPGRMRLIAGKKNALIIDDSYNAAPQSVSAALSELGVFPASKKIAVLGDMLELGNLSEQAHKNIAKEIAAAGVDYFIAVGAQMKLAAQELEAAGYGRDRIFCFSDSTAATSKLEQLIEPGAVLLIKGSQGMRMERITKAIMAEPRQAAQLLCRQDRDWLVK